MSTFFRGRTETVPSLSRGIFSEQNSVPNPSSAPGPVMDFISLLVNNFCYHYTFSLFPGKDAHKKRVLFRKSGDAPTTTCIFWVCNPFGEDYLQKILQCCQTIENIMHRK